MAFEATPPSGKSFVMDVSQAQGGDGLGPSPLEVLAGSLGACSAMDVIGILAKKQQTVDSYRVEVHGERGPEGVYPRPFTRLMVRHVLSGEALDPMAVARAVELSDQKYCSVLATLRLGAQVESSYMIQ